MSVSFPLPICTSVSHRTFASTRTDIDTPCSRNRRLRSSSTERKTRRSRSQRPVHHSTARDPPRSRILRCFDIHGFWTDYPLSRRREGSDHQEEMVDQILRLWRRFVFSCSGRWYVLLQLLFAWQVTDECYRWSDSCCGEQKHGRHRQSSNERRSRHPNHLLRLLPDQHLHLLAAGRRLTNRRIAFHALEEALQSLALRRLRGSCTMSVPSNRIHTG